MLFFVSLVVDGALAGAIYALIALAFVVVYKASGMVNTSRQVGGVFGVAIGVAVAQATGSVTASLVIASGAAAIGAVAAVGERARELVGGIVAGAPRRA